MEYNEYKGGEGDALVRIFPRSSLVRRFFGKFINENRVFLLKKYSRLFNENSLFYKNYIYFKFL